jgi:conjugative transfer region protein TrbK
MRGRFFNWRAIGRAALYALAAIAIFGAAIYLAVGYTRSHPRGVAATAPADRRTAELLRCQALGLEAERDAACHAAWAENRDHFLDGRAGPETLAYSRPRS